MDKTSSGRKKNVTGSGSVNVDKDKKVNGGSVSGATKKPGSSSAGTRKTSAGSSRASSSDKSLVSDLAGAALSGLMSQSSSSSKKKKKTSNNTFIKLIIIGIAIFLAYRFLSSQGCLSNGGGQESFSGESVSNESAYKEDSALTGDESEKETSSESSVTPTVSDSPRDYYTTLKGNKKDTVTVMIYMCGTDLESKYGLATADIKEMLAATYSDNLRIVIQTGGCSKWQNNIITASTTQRYEIKSGKITKIQDLGSKLQMTKASTLSDFIKYCKKNYEANRYALIFWDHGGGSISGYGYDELFSNSSSMRLDTMDQALTDGGVKFDFIGFDACLMATYETAVMCEAHADYLIASEEPEPGYGWYYTDWLTLLAKNSSASTLDVGKKIVDTYISHCKTDSPGSAATLSVVDLAKLAGSVPSKFNAFSASVTEMLAKGSYKTVSNARSAAKEFSPSNRLDQVDLIHFLEKLGTTEAKALVSALKNCIVYNSANESNANGLSIFFPYQRTSYVSTMASINTNIGMDGAYNTLMKNFVTVMTGGQITSTSSGTAVSSISEESTSSGSSYSSSVSDIFDSFFGSSSSSSSGALDSILSIFGSSSTSTYSGTDSLLSSLLGGSSTSSYGSLLTNLFGGSSASSSSSSSDLTSTLISALFGSEERSMMRSMADYYEENRLDASRLTATWKNGTPVLSLTDEEWDLVNGVALNLFIADSDCFIDLGIDNVYDFDDDGDLLLDGGDTWLGVNGQIVAYYFQSYDEETGVTTGFVPCLWNGERANLYFTFDAEGNSSFAGASFLYENETQTVAKDRIQIGQTDGEDNYILKLGDTVEFICDCYDLDGNFQSAYVLGDEMLFMGSLTISDLSLDLASDQSAELTYRLTDIYNNHYWTESVSK